MLIDAQGILEKAGQVSHESAFSSHFGQVGEPGKIQHQRCGKKGIKALPEKLQRHPGTEKSPEVYEIPCGFLIGQRRHIVYMDAGMG